MLPLAFHALAAALLVACAGMVWQRGLGARPLVLAALSLLGAAAAFSLAGQELAEDAGALAFEAWVLAAAVPALGLRREVTPPSVEAPAPAPAPPKPTVAFTRVPSSSRPQRAPR